MDRFGDLLAVGGLNLGGPGDAPASGRVATCRDLPEPDPVVDRVALDAQPCGGLLDGDLAVAQALGAWSANLEGVADPPDSFDVEPVAFACAKALCVKSFGQLLVGQNAAETAGKLDRAGGSSVRFAAGGDDFLGGAGVPAHADVYLVTVVFGQYGDVGDDGAQQPFAVLGAGGWVVPEPGQVGGEALQAVAVGQRRPAVTGSGQRGFRVGQGGQFGLPTRLQRACHQAIFRLDLGEGAFGPVGLVLGALHRQFGGAVRAGVPLLHLLGGVQGEGDLLARQGGQQQPGHRGVDGRGGHRTAALAAGGVAVPHAVVVGHLVAALIAGADPVAAVAAADDALTQRRALPRRGGGGGGGGGGPASPRVPGLLPGG